MLAALHSWRAEISSTPACDQRVGDLEVRRAQEAKAAARPVAGEVAGDDRSHRWIAVHALVSFAGPVKIPSITRPYYTRRVSRKGPELARLGAGSPTTGKSFKLKCLSLKYSAASCHPCGRFEHRRRHRHEDCVPRRRPGGPLFRDQHEAARPRARHHRVRAQPARRHLRLGRGAVRRDARQPRRQRSAQRRGDPRATSPIGTTSRSTIAASASSRAATASPASRASSCSCCCRSARASSASTCVFQTEIDSAAALAKGYDLVVAADGLNSKTRNEFAEYFKPAIDLRKNKFVWLGTQQKFDDAFTFIFEETEHGWIWAHAYQFDADTATFIVECSEATWQKFGFGAMSQDETAAPASAFSPIISAAIG